MGSKRKDLFLGKGNGGHLLAKWKGRWLGQVKKQKSPKNIKKNPQQMLNDM